MALVLILLMALFLFTDIYMIFLSPLDVGEEIAKDFGELILILGGGLKEGFEIGFSTQERLNLAGELYKQEKRAILISDGSLYKGSPAIDKMVNYLLAQGVERQHILYEGKSQTTYDNFLYAREMVKDMNFKEIIVCTSPYHQRRSQLILSHLDLRDFKIAKMVKSEIYESHSIKQRLRNIKLILREYFAILKFKIFRK